MRVIGLMALWIIIALALIALLPILANGGCHILDWINPGGCTGGYFINGQR